MKRIAMMMAILASLPGGSTNAVEPMTIAAIVSGLISVGGTLYDQYGRQVQGLSDHDYRMFEAQARHIQTMELIQIQRQNNTMNAAILIRAQDLEALRINTNAGIQHATIANQYNIDSRQVGISEREQAFQQALTVDQLNYNRMQAQQQAIQRAQAAPYVAMQQQVQQLQAQQAEMARVANLPENRRQQALTTLKRMQREIPALEAQIAGTSSGFRRRMLESRLSRMQAAQDEAEATLETIGTPAGAGH